MVTHQLIMVLWSNREGSPYIFIYCFGFKDVFHLKRYDIASLIQTLISNVNLWHIWKVLMLVNFLLEVKTKSQNKFTSQCNQLAGSGPLLCMAGTSPFLMLARIMWLCSRIWDLVGKWKIIQMTLHHYGHGSATSNHVTVGILHHHDHEKFGFPTLFFPDF